MKWQMGKISSIKTNIMNTLCSSTADIGEIEVCTLRNDLQDFYNDLPPWMMLDQLPTVGINLTLRSTIFDIHLFYLSGMILLSRRLISRGLPYELEQSRLGIMEGLLSAKTAAQLLMLMKHEGSLYRTSWLHM